MTNGYPEDVHGFVPRPVPGEFNVTPELLPCPFCESEVVAVGLLVAPPNLLMPYQVSCGTCGATGPQMHSAYAAVGAWNRCVTRQHVEKALATPGVPDADERAALDAIAPAPDGGTAHTPTRSRS